MSIHAQKGRLRDQGSWNVPTFELTGPSISVCQTA